MTSKARLEFDPEAINEAREARLWYQVRNLKAERAFLTELRRAILNVREAPERWPRFAHGTRRYVLQQFPFSLIYRVKGQSVQVIALAHDKRKPGYWSWRQ